MAGSDLVEQALPRPARQDFSGVLEQVPRIAATTSVALLCVSVSNDWSYLYALGLTLAEVPTTLQDHLRSALVWAPLTVVGLFLGVMLAILAGTGGKAQRFAANAGYWLVSIAAVVLFALGAWQTWWLSAYLLIACLWVWCAYLTAANVPLRLALFGPEPRPAIVALYFLLPFVTITTGGLAYLRGDIALKNAAHRWDLVLKSEAGPEHRAISEIRRFGSSAVVVDATGRVEVLSNDLILQARKLSSGRTPAAAASAPSSPTSSP